MHANQNPEIAVSDRFAVKDDVPGILRCDHQYASDMMGDRWRERDFMQCFDSDDLAIVVVEAAGSVAGYLVVESFKRSFEIHRIAVDNLLLRCGLGGKLVHTLKQRMGIKGKRSIGIDLPEENLRAQQFFRSLGFKAKLPVSETKQGTFYRFVFGISDLFGGRSL